MKHMIQAGLRCFAKSIMRMHRLMAWLSPMRYACGAWGTGSLILSPDLVTGHGQIYVGKSVFVREHARLEAITRTGVPAPRLVIESGVHAELYLHIACAEHVHIGRDVLIAGRVFITDHDHRSDQSERPVLEQGLITAPTVIGDHVWLGEGAVVLKGVHIGDHAVIGANSVVTKSIPAGAIVGGVPARVLRTRNGG